MASIIDSLFIELGIETSKFDAGQKEAIKKIKDVEKASLSLDRELKKSQSEKESAAKKAQVEADKQRKIEEAANKERLNGLNKAKDAILGFGLATLGVAGFKDFVQQTVQGNAALGRQAKILSTSGKDLDAWGKVVEQSGGSLQTFQSSLQSIEGGIADFKIGKSSAIYQSLAQLSALDSVDMQKGTVDLYKLSDAVVRYSEVHGIQAARSRSLEIMDESMFNTMLKGGDAVKDLHDEMYRLSGVTDENIDKATKLNNKWTELAQTLSKNKQDIFGILSSPMGSVLDSATWLMKGGLGGSIYDVLHGENTGDHSLSESHGGHIGSSSGMPRNMRNHNPGNLEYGKFAIAHGAIGSDGRFAIFPNDAVGAAAQSALIAQKIHGGKNTLSKLIESWSPSSENGAANTNAYIADISRRTGIGANDPLSDQSIAAIQQAQQAHEGMIGAKVGLSNSTSSTNSSSVQIQNMNINTSATNAAQLGSDIHSELNNNSFINAGTMGAR